MIEVRDPAHPLLTLALGVVQGVGVVKADKDTETEGVMVREEVGVGSPDPLAPSDSEEEMVEEMEVEIVEVGDKEEEVEWVGDKVGKDVEVGGIGEKVPPPNKLAVGAPLGVTPVPLLCSVPGVAVERNGGEGVRVEDGHMDTEPEEVWLRVGEGETVVVMEEEELSVEESEEVTD